jgi:hypothetical protein
VDRLRRGRIDANELGMCRERAFVVVQPLAGCPCGRVDARRQSQVDQRRPQVEAASPGEDREPVVGAQLVDRLVRPTAYSPTAPS